MSIQLNRRHLLLAGAGVATAAVASSEFARAARTSPAYAPAAGVAKLNANENPYGPSKAAIQAAHEATSSGAYYVSETVPRLKSMIAEHYGLKPANVALSAGSSGALSYIAAAKARHGNILGPDLFWDTTAKMGTRHGGKIVHLPKTADLNIDLEAMLAAITPDISLVQITNPNNPTGLVLPPDQLRKFCVAAAQKCTVLVDEAYNELTDNPEANSMAPLIKQGHDVLVARTFSKIYGMAGMRVGYMLGSEKNIALLESHGLGSYAMNQPGMAAAVACYNDTGFLAQSKAAIVEAREAVIEATRLNGLQPLPSATNFVFVDLGNINAEAFRQAMAQRNVLIRGIYRDYMSWSRVSMGKPADVAAYIGALPEVIDLLS